MESQPQNPEFGNNPENFHSEAITICLIQNFKADFTLGSQPQNSEFGNKPENFHLHLGELKLLQSA